MDAEDRKNRIVKAYLQGAIGRSDAVMGLWDLGLKSDRAYTHESAVELLDELLAPYRTDNEEGR